MAATVLGDVIVPEVFNPYMIERTAELSALWQSGIVAPVADITVPDGGQKVQMPFWQDLVGDDQILSTDTDLTTGNIAAEKDVAIVNGRALVYGAKDLAGALAGDDPMDAIATLIGDKWARQMQKAVISALTGSMGALAAETTPVNVYDISALTGAAAVIDAESLIDAGGMLGDAEGKLTSMAMHSATERKLRKLDLIEYLPDSEGKPTIATYQGKRVIVDDAMPLNAGVYTTYLFGAGAIGYAEGSPKVPIETDRNPAAGGGQDVLYSRRHFVLHPRGIAFTGSAAKDTPTNAELATVSKWARVYESKNVRIVQFRHRLAAA